MIYSDSYIERLEAIREEMYKIVYTDYIPGTKGYGLCSIIGDICWLKEVRDEVWQAIVRPAIAKYCKALGLHTDYAYPIPEQETNGLFTTRAYEFAHTENLYIDTYGAYRTHLAYYILKQIEEELAAI